MRSVSVDLSAELDAGLLLLIGAASDSPTDQALARLAMREFHARHYPYLLGVLKRFAENVGTVVIDPETFVARTFERAFRSASAFEDKSNGNRQVADRKVRSWIGRNAVNLVRDELDRIFRQRSGVQLVALNDNTDTIDESCGRLATEDLGGLPPMNNRALAALTSILDALKPEEHDLLTTYANYGVPTENGRELPPDVRDALERRTGYERSNIRQKWRRLSLRIKSELEPLLANRNRSSSHA